MKKINFNATIKLDKTKPNGTPRKIIDSSIARKYGWFPKIELNKGFDLTLKNYLLDHGR
jgi:GDP-L-fucose synthase